MTVGGVSTFCRPGFPLHEDRQDDDASDYDSFTFCIASIGLRFPAKSRPGCGQTRSHLFILLILLMLLIKMSMMKSIIRSLLIPMMMSMTRSTMMLR